MSTDPPIVVAHPIDSDIRLVQIGPGFDPADEPLLAHAGLACEMNGPIWVAMTGMTGVSDKTRQFLTTIRNDLTEEVLTLLAEEMRDPIRRASTVPIHRRRMDQIKSDLDDIPVFPESVRDEPSLEEVPTPEPDDTPEP
ncbi:hypothetical protein M3N55_12125 [Roseibaca sp. V10]|uniref:Uncharacterized protein n=1 Tax=Roseinatronobacter domitianus TaxID=2940293 RepID=A0ABT0M3P0_9RHOB|nr:hypothetical protein [Roseibaca domitiana]MCL1629478.1 hypothetical protein [Roseibaca domitiana]